LCPIHAFITILLDIHRLNFGLHIRPIAVELAKEEQIMRSPSWKWLSPRFNYRHVTSGSSHQPVARPCIAAMESLDDRILLSAADSSVVVPPPSDAPSPQAQVVSEMINGGIKIAEDEFALIKALSAAPSPLPYPNDVLLHKVAENYFKLNGVLTRLGNDALDGTLDSKIDDAKQKIEYLHVELQDILVTSVASKADEQVSRLLEELQADTNNLTDSLAKLGVTQKIAPQELLPYFKIADSFAKMDDLVIKGELDFLNGGTPGLTVTEAEDKVHKVVIHDISITKDLDKASASLLLPAVQEGEGALIGLLDQLSIGGNFGGGITAPVTDDLIA
jgi:hypothetical protein